AEIAGLSTYRDVRSDRQCPRGQPQGVIRSGAAEHYGPSAAQHLVSNELDKSVAAGAAKRRRAIQCQAVLHEEGLASIQGEVAVDDGSIERDRAEVSAGRSSDGPSQ